MTKHEAADIVTIVGPESTWVETAMFHAHGQDAFGGFGEHFVCADGTLHTGERWVDRRMDDEEGPLRLTAWRPAPAPYRGGK